MAYGIAWGLLLYDSHLHEYLCMRDRLGMHSLHRTWGDGLLARGKSSCFLFFLGS
jgi:hypothetical protein